MAIKRLTASSIITGRTYNNILSGYPAKMSTPTASDGGTGTTVSVAFTPQSGATSYTVISSPGSLTASGSSSPITVSGLTAGTAYTFQIAATNSIGTGAYSDASNSVTPVALFRFLANTDNLDTGTGSAYFVQSTFVDSSGNHYAAARWNTNNWLMKRNNAGASLVQRRQVWSVGTPFPWATTSDSSGNIIWAGSHNDGTNYSAFIQSFNSDMSSANWRLLFKSNDSSGVTNSINGLTTDSSGNIYAVGTSDTSTGFQSLVVLKINSSGTIQWKKKLQINNRYASGQGIALDSSGNVYVIGSINNSAGTQITTLYAKYNSSGVLQIAYTEQGTGDRYGRAIFVDSSGNIYTSAFMSSYYYISKMDSSFNVLWRDGRTYGSTDIQGLWVDSAGNVYASGWAYPTDRYIGWWTKYDSSGSVQLQRSITANANTIQWISQYRNAITPNNSTIVLQARLNGPSSTSYNVALQVPTDGTKTGTYTFPAGLTSNNISYASISAIGTDTSSPTRSTLSPSDVNWDVTNVTGVTYTLSNLTYSNGVLNI